MCWSLCVFKSKVDLTKKYSCTKWFFSRTILRKRNRFPRARKVYRGKETNLLRLIKIERRVVNQGASFLIRNGISRKIACRKRNGLNLEVLIILWFVMKQTYLDVPSNPWWIDYGARL